MNRRRGLLAAAGAGVLVASLAACGGSGDNDNGSGDGSSWTLGTTDSEVTSVDPAGSYDFPSWNLQYNIFQQLMVVPAGESEPAPDAAESCDYDNPKQITCKLRSGLKFSNGDDLTSSDVKFSFERNIAINDPDGSAVLLGSITDSTDPDHPKLADNAIETPDDTTVVFHLNKADTTFMKVLTSATASIVDEDVFPADSLLADDKVIGSGPYKLSQYKAKEQAVLEKNAKYSGEREGKTDRIFVQYFSDSAPLKQAIDSGQVDIAWRTLSPTDLNDLAGNAKLDVLRGQGSEFRYWVWQLGTPVGKQKAIRQAAAYIIDRDAIAKDAYDGTVQPAYSIVPPGFGGQKDSFKDKYGATPDVDKAKQLLADAGIKTPVSIRLGYTPSHYGPNAVDEANELGDQLEQSGLFKVKKSGPEWKQYQTLYKQNAFDLFILGWYPDFLDADNYLTPFIRDGGFFANHYSNKQVNTLLDQELAETDATKREAIIGQLQDITAEDVPLIPSWNGQNVAVATKVMQGVKDTLDPTYIFRFWGISKK